MTRAREGKRWERKEGKMEEEEWKTGRGEKKRGSTDRGNEEEVSKLSQTWQQLQPTSITRTKQKANRTKINHKATATACEDTGSNHIKPPTTPELRR